MNVCLLDPFEPNIPDGFTHTVKADANTEIIKLNRRGTLLATATRDGLIQIFDLITMNLVQQFKGHVAYISHLSWSRCGRFIMSASKDWNVIIWDLKSGRRKDTIKFHTNVLMATFNPQNKDCILVLLQGEFPIILSRTTSLVEKGQNVLRPRKTSTGDIYVPLQKKIKLQTEDELNEIIEEGDNAKTVCSPDTLTKTLKLNEETHTEDKGDAMIEDNTAQIVEPKLSLSDEPKLSLSDVDKEIKAEADVETVKIDNINVVDKMFQKHPKEDDNVQSNIKTNHFKSVLREKWSSLTLQLPSTRSGLVSTVGTFTPDGKYFVIGTNKGTLFIFNTETKLFDQEFKVTGASSIRQIQFNRSGREMIVNSNDRIIRLYLLEEVNGKLNIEIEQKFQDAIEKTQWIQCQFSADGEYIIGGCESTHQHNIYLWDRVGGNLVKMLEGPQNEGLTDIAWHPIRPILISASMFYGHIYYWQHIPTQKFSGFEPDFKELTDNIEYNEREDEFDLNVEIVSKTREEDQIVDIDNNHGMNGMLSDTSDDENHQSFHIPIKIE
ncbi:WD40-repeat-containing domain protein [Globomyces pollinis-pini]|nr:WD40-repeat-containing domain protein [Globomyces pollinis-pini]